MASWARTRLLAAAGFLMLSLLPWQAQAGTPEAPEITDPSGDHDLAVVPVGQTGQFLSADVLAAWVTEDADNVLFNIDLAGTGTSGTGGPYQWTFHATADGTEVIASATSTAAQPTPGGVATAAANDGGTITLTVPRTAFGAATVLTGLFIETSGGTPTPNPAAIIDRAPDSGAGTDYPITGAGGSNPPGDTDGDGLNDTWETEQFGDITRHNGTSDPDGDGLNNTREFTLGTNATNEDTDGDGLSDGEDPDPLVPAGAANDADGDGLNDTWERGHFTTLTAQNGTGDPDADGLDNTREQALGTDPNEADTDGDGLDDGEDPSPLVPNADEANEAGGRKARPELYSGAAMFAVAATFLLLGLAKGI